MEGWLIARTLKGDPVAADALIARHYGAVHRFLRHLTSSPEDASDLTQQTFSKLRQSLAGYREEGSFKGWLFRIAYREYLHWQREREPDRIPLAEGFPGKTPLPEDAITLLGAIDGLPEELRTPFWLREVERLSVREVAESLGVPEGTVKSRCHQAKARLRDKLATAWGIPNEVMEADHVV